MVDILPYKEISLLPNRIIKPYKSRVADPDPDCSGACRDSKWWRGGSKWSRGAMAGGRRSHSSGVEAQNGAVKDL